MAGWKLRKDKAQADTPSVETETAEFPDAAAATAEPGIESYSGPLIGEESPAANAEHTPAPGFEVDGGLHFEDEDSPLKLMDYSAPSDDLLPLSSASASPIIAAPPPDMPVLEAPVLEAPVLEAHPIETPAPQMPTLATPSFDTSATEPEAPAGDFTSTLRMSREELAAALSPPSPGGIPPVAPFVLDTPLVSPATETMPPRLVVRMGRLSAAFDLTKEVTVVGRPDSEMHYYPDVEIDLDDAVSRRHAEIIKRDDHFVLVDTGSTNGTLLNGERLPAHDERPLTHGDRIRVGERTEIIFE